MWFIVGKEMVYLIHICLVHWSLRVLGGVISGGFIN